MQPIVALALHVQLGLIMQPSVILDRGHHFITVILRPAEDNEITGSVINTRWFRSLVLEGIGNVDLSKRDDAVRFLSSWDASGIVRVSD